MAGPILRILRFVGIRCDTNARSWVILRPSHLLEHMLDFCKTVLMRVSFDRNLFQRELKKSFLWLSKDDAEALRRWALSQYSHKYHQVIASTFAAAQMMS